MYTGEFSLVAGRLKDQVCIPEPDLVEPVDVLPYWHQLYIRFAISPSHTILTPGQTVLAPTP